MSKAIYDVIVIGAGIEGSSSAYNLAKRGKKVLLLEQFPLPHSRGSSHGQSRITRYAYADEFYVRMMVDAFPMWAELERESGENFFVNCGLLDLHLANSKTITKVTSSLKAHDVPHEVISPGELKRRFPHFKAGDNCAGVWDPSGGLLRADRALKAFQTVFQKLGGVLRDEEPVTKVTPGDVVTVETPRSVYKANSLVIAAGAWAGRFCSSLGLNVPLQPVRTVVMYWKVDKDKIQNYSDSTFPCFIDSRTEATFTIYGFPNKEYPGLVKICLHQGAITDPDERDKVDNDSWILEEVKRILALTFDNLENQPAIREYCMYTNTPDHHPYIDRHPTFHNIVIAAGFSGHGFKLAPAVGKAVSELVLNDTFTYNMEPFKLNRFSPKANL
ncbi:peroxisomal sarcosine oxidase [Biomphalaria glabrata]|nr:peroxisomal sarcosine oxidase [Biomphalaria glabrata]